MTLFTGISEVGYPWTPGEWHENWSCAYRRMQAMAIKLGIEFAFSKVDDRERLFAVVSAAKCC